jgi:hypothetical protein
MPLRAAWFKDSKQKNMKAGQGALRVLLPLGLQLKGRKFSNTCSLEGGLSIKYEPENSHG